MPRVRSLLMALPLIELALLIGLGVLIGGGIALLVVLGTFVLGLTLIKLGQRGTTTAAHAGRPSPFSMMRRGPVVVSGALLMMPGLLTDALGLLLLIPGFRKLLMLGGRKLIARRLAKAGLGGMPFGDGFPFSFENGGPFGSDPRTPGNEPSPPTDGGPVIVEAEVVDERPEP